VFLRAVRAQSFEFSECLTTLLNRMRGELQACGERRVEAALLASFAGETLFGTAGSNDHDRTKAMRFLLRAAFWLGVVSLLLPMLGSMSGSDRRQAPALGAADAASAASATLSDMRQFCSRQPDACAIGAQVAIAAGHTAQAGAKMLYEFLSETLASADPETPASGAALERRDPTLSGGVRSQHTLTPGDLAPDWRGPVKSKEPARRRTQGYI
jgi:hypothetical protein